MRFLEVVFFNISDSYGTNTRQKLVPSAAPKSIALRRSILAAFLFLLQSFNFAMAITPENGMYWEPSRPANLYVIEYQKGTMVLVIYSYDAQGRPEWYSASGPLQQIPSGGEFPADHAQFDAPLARAVGGPPLGTQGHAPGDALAYPSFMPVGRVLITFYAEAANYISIRINDVELSGELQPFNFGFGDIGQDLYVPWQTCWPDLTGEWVFVDKAQPTKPAWRYRFAAPTVRAWDQFDQPIPTPVCRNNSQTHWIEYRDMNSNAVMRCVQHRSSTVASTILPAGAMGCEVVDGNTVVMSSFWSSYDRQLKRFRAWPGPASAVTYDQILSDPNGPTITGYRIE